MANSLKKELDDIENFNTLCCELFNIAGLPKPYRGAFCTNGAANIPSGLLDLIRDEMPDESWYFYPKFHSDWNWIFEMLNKISSLGYDWKITSKYVQIYSHTDDPRGYFDCKHEINCPEKVLLDVVKTINQFLVWQKANQVQAQ